MKVIDRVFGPTTLRETILAVDRLRLETFPALGATSQLTELLPRELGFSPVRAAELVAVGQVLVPVARLLQA